MLPTNPKQPSDSPVPIPAVDSSSLGKFIVENGNSGTIDVAVITDAWPHLNCYRIQRGGKASSVAIPLGATSRSTIHGTNELMSYQVGTPVIVFYPSEMVYAFIIGSIPLPIYEGNLAIPPVIMPGSGAGIIDPLFESLAKSKDNNGKGLGLVNASGGNPTDHLLGDWGAMNELGVGILVSKLVAMIRAAPNCGIYTFYLDNLLRIHAYNHELFTSSTEHRVYNDEGEVHDVYFGTKFPWEAQGVRKNNVKTMDNDKSVAWKKGETKARYEPKRQDQTGVWRDIVLRGYLGDLYRHTIVLTDSKYDSTPVGYSDSSEPITKGLSEITEGADGRVGIRSAKEIILSKYSLIPAPQQLALPEDPNADWNKNYKASGVLGSGATPPEQKDWTWHGDDTAGDLRAAYLPEYLAYVFNWYKVQNIVAHKKDWKLPEENESPSNYPLKKTVIEAATLTDLSTKFWAGIPKSHNIDIDSRMKGIKYYESMSALAMMDDGSVVIEDGWGSSIVLSRGNIQICSAGDILFRPGRSMHVLAPKDVTLRAGGSMDLTTTTKDIRIKAEANMQLLAGNDSSDSLKSGGILLESRSAGMHMDFTKDGEKVVSGGVVIRCPGSDFAVWGNNVYVGTKTLGNGVAGNIMLSADEGKRDIITQSLNFYRDIKAQAVDRFAEDAKNVYTKGGTFLDTKILSVRGSIGALNKGFIIADGGLICNRGVYAGESVVSGGAVIWGGDSATMVGPGGDKVKQLIPPYINAISSKADEIQSKAGTSLQKDIDAFQIGDNIGSATLAKKVKFSLRTDDDYKAPDFKLYATRWQQLCKDLGVSTYKWKEREVQGNAATFPFPGRNAYIGSDKFVGDLEFKLFKSKEGYATARGEDGAAYTSANNTVISGKSLNEYQAMVPVE